MIERYVFIKLSSEDATPAGRRQLAEMAKRMFPTMDGVETFKVAVQSEKAGECPWDLALTIGFPDLAAATRYMKCPIHAEFDGELAMMLEDIESRSFELV